MQNLHQSCHAQGPDIPLQPHIAKMVASLCTYLLLFAEPQRALTPCIPLCSILEMR